MAQRDGTGPQGQGSRTGRGLGPCGGGMRKNGNFGFGQRRFFSKKNELTSMEEEKEILEKELIALKEEIKALKDEA